MENIIKKLQDCFGTGTDLPIAFWFSEQPANEVKKAGGCMFKAIAEARKGEVLTLCENNVLCGGGKFYLGFAELPEQVPMFVSLKEKYKKTPDEVASFVKDIDVQKAPHPYFNLARIDKLDNLNNIEGIFFIAKADVIAGLSGWAFFDNNSPDAVRAPFGSGCSVIFSNTITENHKGGNCCFLGLFDPSVRPWVRTDELGFAIPKSRLTSMIKTIDECFLSDSNAWKFVKKRI